MKRIFTVPFYLLLFVIAACQPQKAYQTKGQEVFPPVSIKYAALFRMDQLPISPDFFHKQWTLVLFGDSVCNVDCQQRLKLANQVSRARVLFVLEDLADHKRLRELAGSFPSVAISMGTTAASYDNFAAQFIDESMTSDDRRSNFYLINPDAELVYRLPANPLKMGDIDKELELLQ